MSTPEIDRTIKKHYEALWEQARKGQLETWMVNPDPNTAASGCLALCIILDQFPLNMFRGSAKSFSTEQQAVAISKLAISRKLDHEVSSERLSFLYMPLMHSENLSDQDLSVALFEKAGLEHNVRFAKHHREIIRQFGRFPHRNALLKRQSTDKEIEYLNSKQAFKG